MPSKAIACVVSSTDRNCYTMINIIFFYLSFSFQWNRAVNQFFPAASQSKKSKVGRFIKPLWIGAHFFHISYLLTSVLDSSAVHCDKTSLVGDRC